MLKFFKNFFNTSTDNIDEEKKLLSKYDLLPISDVHERKQVKIGGVVKSVTYFPHSATGSLSVGISLFDGTASIDVVWLGRKNIPGIQVGVVLIVEGTVLKQDSHLSIINPIYKIVV